MDNFYDTAKRMHRSSETLHNNAEYHNACYLAGYVVECYAKVVVGLFSSHIPRNFRHNIVNLNNELQYLLGSNSSLSSYIVNGSTDFSQIILYWNPVNLRYIENSNSISSQTISEAFQNEIQLAMQKLAQMQLDGHILI
jgi:hypothetical protein